MENTVIGYQYAADTNRYIGSYTFPVNADSGNIHLPPNTVLDAPPSIPAGKAAFRINGDWVLNAETMQTARPAISDYAMLTSETIALLKSQGVWSDADQAAYDAATQK
jgi:hypothetical protein